MRILMTGGTGFIGSALIPALEDRGHEVIVLTRSPSGPGHIGSLDEIGDDAQIDAIINLAGESLNGRRWNEAFKRELLDSRLGITGALVSLCKRLRQKPAVLVSASAIGWYGPRGDELLTEESAAGEGFSASLCSQWEAAAQDADTQVDRVVIARLGVVFDDGGGAFEQMVQPFRMRVANWVGSGRQWISWIHRRDVVAAMIFLLDRQDLTGVFNLTAPEPVTSRGFCSSLRRHIRTLPPLPLPGFVMRLMLGEVADELLITGQRVQPARLIENGFAFTYPDLDAALPQLLGQEDRAA